MSRSNYSDDYEYFDLYRGTVERSIKGKRGQKFLRELADTLDKMQTKRLIKSELISDAGECCTIGTVCRARGIDVSKVDVYDPYEVGALVGISRSMAAEIEYENDESHFAFSDESPEDRWTRMRKWVGDNLEEK